ncbi:MAG: radical SAM protein [Nitrospiraceae bacterium]|nr:MAG: radical SAM protein [Nitrospiraceae bacterium]
MRSFIKRVENARKNPHLLRLFLKNKIAGTRRILLNPSTIFLAVNGICNLRCAMCDVGMRNRDSQFYRLMSGTRQELLPDRVKTFIDEVKYFNPIIAITSTEPLLYGPLFDISEYIISRGLELYITTNGLLLEKYAETMVRLNVPLLQVSLDGPPEIHNRIRGVEKAFEKAMDGIRLVTDYKRKYNSEKPKIGINYTISNLNDTYLFDFSQLMNDTGVSSITFSHLNYVTEKMAEKHNSLFADICQATPSSMSSDVVDPTKVDFNKLWEQIRLVKGHRFTPTITFVPEIRSRDILFDFYNRPEVIVANDKCSAPWTVMQIMGNGDAAVITRCLNVRLGNIYKDSFDEIWHGECYKKFREALRKHNMFPACTRCCGVL